MGAPRTIVRQTPAVAVRKVSQQIDQQKSRKKFSGGFYNMETISKINKTVSGRRATIDNSSHSTNRTGRRVSEMKNAALTKEEILGFLTKVSLNQEPSIDGFVSAKNQIE